jgi:hypothetical protein
MALLNWFLGLFNFGKNSAPRKRKFYYVFQQTPFTEFIKFSVKASDQKEANELAGLYMKKMADEGVTVVDLFYPLKPKI